MKELHPFISLRIVLAKTIAVIKIDYAVLLPTLIAAFLSILLGGHILQGPLPTTAEALLQKKSLEYMMVAGLLNLFAQAITIVLVDHVLHRRSGDIASAFLLATRRFLYLACVLLCGFLCIGLVALPIAIAPPAIAFLFWFPFLFLITLFAQLIPVIVMLEQGTVLDHIRILIAIFRNTFSNLLRFFFILVTLNLLTIFLGTLLETGGAAASVKQVIMPLLQGLNNGIAAVVAVVFYLENKTGIRVDV